MMRRLFTVSETALAGVRTRTFRHIHDLSMLHQQSERRGSLVSRVTSDVDQITQFLQWGGVILLSHLGPDRGHHDRDAGLLVAAHPGGVRRVRARWSWSIRLFQRRLAAAYGDGPRAGRRDARRGRRERRRGRGDPGVRRGRAHRAQRLDDAIDDAPAWPSSGRCAPA